MNIEVIPIAQLPADSRMLTKHKEIYRAAAKLRQMGLGAAIRVSIEGEDVHKLQRKVHASFRSSNRDKRLKTKWAGAYLYLWLESMETARFERTAVPMVAIERKL